MFKDPAEIIYKKMLEVNTFWTNHSKCKVALENMRPVSNLFIYDPKLNLKAVNSRSKYVFLSFL